MSTTTIPAGTKIYPYSTPDGIIQLVPLEALEKMSQERDQLNDAVAELNQRLIERTRDMLAKQSELVQEARKARSVARRALDFLDGVAQIFQVCADDRRFKPSDRSNMQKCADGVRAEAKPLRAELEAFDALPVRPNAAECGQRERVRGF